MAMPIYDINHSKTVVGFLERCKELYDQKSVMMTITFNPQSGHQTPFLVQLPNVADDIVHEYPGMGPGPNMSLFYVPQSPVLDNGLMFPRTSKLDVQKFLVSHKYQALSNIFLQVSDYVKWHNDQ